MNLKFHQQRKLFALLTTIIIMFLLHNALQILLCTIQILRLLKKCLINNKFIVQNVKQMLTKYVQNVTPIYLVYYFYLFCSFFYSARALLLCNMRDAAHINIEETASF